MQAGELLGGAGNKDGVFPRLFPVNSGQFRDFETALGQYVREYGADEVDIVFKCSGSSIRPERIVYNLLQNAGKVMHGRF